MSVVSSLFNISSAVIQGAAKVVLVSTRIAVVSAVTTAAGVAAIAVQEAQRGASQVQANANIQAGVEACKSGYITSTNFVHSKVTAIEAAAVEFETKFQ